MKKRIKCGLTHLISIWFDLAWLWSPTRSLRGRGPISLKLQIQSHSVINVVFFSHNSQNLAQLCVREIGEE